MSQLPGQTPARPTSTDIDLYCLQCGYNLRGLSGDPRRCPECGHLNPMGELEIPAALISAQLRRMESGPAMCALGIIVSLLPLLIYALVWLRPYGWDREGLVCCSLPGLGGPFVWIAGVAMFRDSCLGKPGWKRALWHYHLHAVPLAGAVVLFWSLGTFVPDCLSYYHGALGYFPGKLKGLLEAARPFLMLSVPLIIVAGGYWPGRRVKKIIQPLQREVAVSMAREELQKRLRTGGRGYYGKG